MTGCAYFVSDHWTATVREAVRAWDVRDFARRTDLVADAETFLANAEAALDVPAERATLGALLDDEGVAVDASDEALAASWVDRWEVETTCPHEVHADERCIFHLPPERTDAAALHEAFREAIADPETSTFVGARFGTFDLSDEVLARAFNHPLDLSYASFDALTLRETTIDTRVDLSFATVRGALDWRGATLGGKASCIGLTVDDRAAFTHCEFDGRARFQKASFGGPTHFNYATFDRGTLFRNVRFGDDAEFRDADFRDVANFKGCSVAGELEIRYASFAGGARFRWASFRGPVDFHDARFERGATFEGAAFESVANFRHCDFVTGTTYEEATFGADADFYDVSFGRRVAFTDTTFEADARFTRTHFVRIGRFDGTRFAGDATFRYAIFDELAEFTDVTVAGTLDFEEAELAELRFEDVRADRAVDLGGASLGAGEIRYADPPETAYDLSGATVGPVRLRFAGVNPFERLRIVETNFQGFEFSDAEHRRFLKRNWQLHTTPADDAPGRYERVENTYLKAKNGANEVGDNRAASAFFLQEMKYRRRAQFQLARDGKGVGRAVSGGKWLVSWFFSLTCGYGERPENTLLSAVGTVLLFAGLFYVAGIEFADPSDYVIVSIQSFVALIMGSLPKSSLDQIKLLTSLEAFIGAFFIGLFVFSLTRSIHR